MADAPALSSKLITLACLALIALALGGLLVGFGQPAPGWKAGSVAPPVTPHPVDANDVTSCYQCHGEGKVIDTLVAPKISHPRYTNCTQCHAPVAVQIPGNAPGLVVDNVFRGQISAGKGTRAYLGAPPTLPHPTLMRENCLACHGLLGQQGLRTPHPWRVNCLQCHPPDASLEQQKADDQAPPPWAGETGKP